MQFIKQASLIICIATVAACATTVKERVIVHDRPETQHVVIKHAPAPIVEVIPTAPAVSATWVPGHWVWFNTKWEWVPGHWHHSHVRTMPPTIVEQITVAPAPHAYWVPGHWKFEGSDWVWIKGRWYY